MKSTMKLRRTATWTGAVLVFATMAAFAMPAQAAYVGEKVTSTARKAVSMMCERFCGCHHHHHAHEWCNGYRDYWCPGHH